MPDQPSPDLPTLIRLSALYVHPLNTRSDPPPADIAALADSIRSVGLLQNLMGYADPDPVSGKDDPDCIGIVAGGRRLRALRLIHGDDDPMIPVIITTDETRAREWAGAENSARAALHPADEVIAYRKMARAGAHPNAIARAFAVTERHVLGRMKLAALPDPAIAALRAGQLSLDQAAALTVAESEADALAGLEAIRAARWPMSADQIRKHLLPEALPATDRRAKFVGLMAYRCEGGRVQEGLFGEDTRLLDPQILDRVFAEKLEAARQQYIADGWSEVVAFTSGYPNHDHAIYRMDRIHPTPVDLPEADQDELDRLEAIGEQREYTEAEAEALDHLTTRAEGYYTDADMATGTAAIYVNGKGDLEFFGAFRRKGAAAGAGADGEGEASVAKPETIPQNLIDDLRIIRTLAIQTALLDKTELMLDLLAITLTAPLYNFEKPLSLSPTAQTITPSKPDEAIISPRLEGALPEGGRASGLSPHLLTVIQDGGRKARNTAITAALARTFNHANTDFGDALAVMIGADVRKVWTPTASNYFGRLPGAMLDRIMADLVPDHLYDASTFRALKKADKAKQLHDLFAGHDSREALGLSREANARIDAWLPPELVFTAPASTAASDCREEAA